MIRSLITLVGKKLSVRLLIKENIMEGLTEGRIVHFVMPDGEHRPAIVVKVWDKETGYVNLQVFTDGKNDRIPSETQWNEEVEKGMYWATSIYYSEDHEPISWHWIEKA